MLRSFLSLLFLLTFSLSHSSAQDSLTLTNDSIAEKTVKQTRGSLLKRIIRSFDKYDKTYITPNYYNYSAMLQNTTGLEFFRLEGKNSEGRVQSISLNSSPTFRVGPYFGWRWIFLGYTFDIGRTYTSRKKSELNFSVYSSMIGFDFVFKKNEGNFEIQKVEGFDKTAANQIKGRQFNGLSTNITSLNTYYIFNHKHFSYPAAFSQSTVQRISCGTWKLGFTYSHQKVSFDYTLLPTELSNGGTDENWLNNELKFKEINYYDWSINFGYAYNWVFAKNCLFCLSLSPAIGYKYTNAEKPNVKDAINYNIDNLNFDIISRIGIVWNNTKWFGGLSLIVHSYSYKKDRFSINNTFGYLNLYCGLNFKKRK